jgi:hypothetical protein
MATFVNLGGRQVPVFSISPSEEELESFGEANGVDAHPEWLAQKAQKSDKVRVCQQCSKPPPEGTSLKRCAQVSDC